MTTGRINQVTIVKEPQIKQILLKEILLKGIVKQGLQQTCALGETRALFVFKRQVSVKFDFFKSQVHPR